LIMQRKCADELIGTMDRTLKLRGPDFLMAGLLHGVALHDVPPALRMRPCFCLGDPGWKQRLAQIVQQRMCHENRDARKDDTRFMWRVHRRYGGDPSMTAIEVGPKVESMQYWRFAVPKTIPTVRWGVGMAGGGDISPIKFEVVRGYGRYADSEVVWFGAANGLSAAESAYLVFSGPLPDFVCFGPAKNPSGPPGQMEMHRPTMERRTQ
jgi:hypothetical protein